MSVTSERTIGVRFSGDINQNDVFGVTSTVSPGQIDIITANSGNNTIVWSTVTGIVPKGVVIIPPVGNTTNIALKGTTADVGILLHPSDPCSLSLGVPGGPLQFVLAVSNTIAGIRLIWT